MNTKDFEYLVALARNKSILKASQELYISQPALSKFLQRMEQEAGTRLFQHVGKNLVPTSAGEYCIEKAIEILHLNDQIENHLSDTAHLAAGRIRLGLPMSRTDGFLSRILPRFCSVYPGIHLEIVEEAAQILLQKVQSGELGIIFINCREPISGLQYQEVSEEEMVLAAPASYKLAPLAFKKPGYRFACLRPEDWRELPYIMLSQDQATRTFTNQYFQLHGIVPRTVLQIRNLGQAVNAVHHGLGVTITPSMLSPLETEQQQIQYFSLPGDGGPFLRKTAVVYRKDTDLSRAEQDLIALICSEFGA